MSPITYPTLDSYIILKRRPINYLLRNAMSGHNRHGLLNVLIYNIELTQILK